MIQLGTSKRRLYEAAWQLYKRNLAQCNVAPPFCLAFFTDRTRVNDPISAISKLPRGGGRKRCAVILRDYDLPTEERYALGLRLRRLCRQNRHLLIVAGDRHLAFRLRADGLHLPDWQLQHGVTSWRYGITTASCHSVTALRQAEAARVAAVFVSPILATDSHPGSLVLGVNRAARLRQNTFLSVYGLGGINSTSQQRLKAIGLNGFGVIGALRD